MRFLRYTDVARDGAVQTFKDATWRGIAWAMVILACVTAYTAIPKGEPTSPLIIAIPASATLLMGLLLLGRLRPTLSPRNWLVKASEEGLYLNLQSNPQAPLVAAAPEAMFIPAGTIASVNRVQELRTLPERHGSYKNYYTYFDLELQEPVPETLLVALAQVRRNPALRRGIGIRSDFVGAIRIEGPTTIRLLWDWMTPRELEAARWFAARYPAEPFRKMEAPGWDALSGKEREDYIDTLWEYGYVEDAVHLSSMTRGTTKRVASRYLLERLG